MARSPPNMGHHGGANMGNFGQQQQKAPPSSFSMMNIVPVYTLLVVGYAVYIWFKVKARKDDESTESKIKNKKSELDDLRERLARTEEALQKLVIATEQLSKVVPEVKIDEIFDSNREVIADLMGSGPKTEVPVAEKNPKKDEENESDSNSENDIVEKVETLKDLTLEDLENSDSEEKLDSEEKPDSDQNSDPEENSEDEPQVISMEDNKSDSDEPKTVRKRILNTEKAEEE